jgi:hypothetical protein
MGWLSRLLPGEDAETREARKHMARDLTDPRRAFVWGVVAVSYELDPAYMPEHATEAIRDWYGVKSADDLLGRTAANFVANDHVAYNAYRLCFLARAGFGAGMLDATQSWDMAIRHAAVVQQHYGSWAEYGRGYLEGHLSYRAHQGDAPDQLAQYRRSIGERLDVKQRNVWSGIPWATRM